MAQNLTTTPEYKYGAIDELQKQEFDVSYTIGARAGAGPYTVTVTIQCLVDRTQANAARAEAFQFYISDASNGLAFTASGPSGGVAAGASGAVLQQVTAKSFIGVTTAAGALTVVFTHNATAVNFYLVAIMPNGRLVVSPAVAF